MIGYFERSLSRFIACHGNSASGAGSESYECEAERGRILDEGNSYLLGGAPPVEWSCQMPRPVMAEDLSALSRALQNLCRSCRGRLQLHYSALTSHRITRGRSLENPQRSFTAWALTGWMCAQSRSNAIPIGWSGKGEGGAWIRNEAPQELDWLCSCLEGAGPAQSGSVPAVLSPSAAAVILHEAIGHRAEGSVSLGCPVGVVVASEWISVMDDPRAQDGPVSYDFDDENVRCLGPTTLVSEGRLVAQLHSPRTAIMAGTLPTPNARAASCWDVPIPLMSNLICAAGART